MTVNALVGMAADAQMPALGITDNHNMFGSLEFSLACTKKGIQPIIGCQFSMIPHVKDKNATADQILLIAQNEAGYQNLLKLISNSYLHQEDEHNPYLSFETVAEHAEGIIALSAGIYGAIGKAILKNNLEMAGELTQRYKAVFGDRFYIELMRHQMQDERLCEPHFLELAKAHDVPVVATNDIYFKDTSMQDAHDALICIAEGRYVTEENRRKLTPHHRFKSQDEMRELFNDLPEAIENTALIAKRCAVMSEARAPILPGFAIEENGKTLSEADALRKVAKDGLDARMKAQFDENAADWEEKTKPYYDRLEYELGIIINMGFPGYFLIVSDFITWSKEQDIPVGPGRGSGAASVVAWSLLITDLDPLQYDLVFERFLNPERVSMPDFDIDFCQDRREEVIRYVQQKYGADKVAQIITFGKLQARAVLRDVGRVLQMPYGQVDRICKLVPANPANPVTLAEALEIEPQLKEQMQGDETVKKLVEFSLQLEGLYRHCSTHAAGVVIADRPLDELVPLYRDPKSDMPVVQYSMKYAETAGLVKFDFLGLKTLTVLAQAVKFVNEGNAPHQNSDAVLTPPQGGSYNTKNLAHAKSMRKEMTPQEHMLWQRICDNQLGFKFRRQQPIGDYIVDFYCAEKKLIIEIDGSQHAENSNDSKRDNWLKAQGYNILRFWNNDITDNLNGCLEQIINSPLEGESKDSSLLVGGQLDLAKIPLDDPATYKLLCEGKTIGVFQFESAGMRDSLRKLKPDRLEDLVALGALYRPGPMDNIPTYIDCKHGRKDPDYLHPKLQPVLEETYGVIIYQEQVQKIAQILSGYTLGGADLLRRAMGKKIQAEMDAQRKIFVEGAENNNVSGKQANEIFDLVAKFAGYGFNKAHAAAYALIGYQTAYLKANYAKEFLAASMNYDMQNTDKLSIFKQDIEQLGFKLLSPDINASQVNFSVEDGNVRYGLAALKNVGEQAMQDVIAARDAGGAFKDMFDVVSRVGAKVLNRRQFEHLIAAGVFDSIHPNRHQLYASVDMLIAYGQNEAEQRESTQESLFGGDTIEIPKPTFAPVEEWAALEKLSHEFKAVGFYLSAHPLEGYATALEMMRIKTLAQASAKMKSDYNPIKLAGIVMGKKIKNSQKGKFAFVQMSDASGVYEASIFDEHRLNEWRDLLENGTIVLIHGDAKMEEAGPRIIITEMTPLDEALKKREARGGELTVIISNAEAVAQIKTLCTTPSPKGFALTLHADAGDGKHAVIELGKRYDLTPEAIMTLKQMRGVEVG